MSAVTEDSPPIPEPPYLVMLDITSFRGISIGAEHYYGKIHINNKSNKGGYGAPRHPLDSTEITRPITEELARQLDEKDNDDMNTYRHSIGQGTYRFDSEEQVIEFTKKFFEKNFDSKRDVLIIEEDFKCEIRNYWLKKLIALAGPDDIKKDLEWAGTDYERQLEVLKNHRQ